MAFSPKLLIPALALFSSLCWISASWSANAAEIVSSTPKSMSKMMELKQIVDADLVRFVFDAEYISANKNSAAFYTKLFEVTGYRDCTGPTTCPANDQLYIGVTMDGEGGAEYLYQSPPAYDWKFVQWLPDEQSVDEPPAYSRFEADGEQVHLPDGRIIEKGKFEIGVGFEKSYIKQIK